MFNIKSIPIIGLVVTSLLFSSTPINAAINNCGLENVAPNPENPQTLDITFCAYGDTQQELLQLNRVKVVCNQNSGGTTCRSPYLFGPPPLQEKGVDNAIVNITPIDNGYYSCFVAQQINRDVGNVDIEILSNNTSRCTVRNINTTPADYGFTEHLSRSIESRTGGSTYNVGIEGPTIICATGGINTALGCIDTSNFGKTISQILAIVIGIGGGLALLLMGYGVFIITTSSGIPDKLNEGKAIITSAAVGLIFIILSTVLYQIVGVSILHLPGLQ